MIENSKNEVQESDKLLTAIMALLNITLVVLVGVCIWSVFSVVENSTAVAKFMNGSFMP
jgi:hypothetical protein